MQVLSDHSAARWLRSYGLVPVLALLAAACASSKGAKSDAGAAAPRAASTSTVGSDEISRAPKQSVDQYLNGRFSGVQITPTADGGIAVRIRGSTSAMGNNEPLYILDGVAIQPGPAGALVGINPYDIASIKVLKDLADITMYGVRGANGVVVIKTKRATAQ
jgi:TonB-dependent SusC/RagA subfamily outer membrane receptor